MNWGRYAEIFDYDRANGRLMQAEPSPEPAAAPAIEAQKSPQ